MKSRGPCSLLQFHDREWRFLLAWSQSLGTCASRGTFRSTHEELCIAAVNGRKRRKFVYSVRNQRRTEPVKAILYTIISDVRHFNTHLIAERLSELKKEDTNEWAKEKREKEAWSEQSRQTADFQSEWTYPAVRATSLALFALPDIHQKKLINNDLADRCNCTAPQLDISNLGSSWD